MDIATLYVGDVVDGKSTDKSRSRPLPRLT